MSEKEPCFFLSSFLLVIHFPMNTTVKVIIGIIIAVLVIWGIVALSKSAQQNPVSNTKDTSPMKIGVIGPFTGDAAVYGEPLRNVIQLATDDINDKGGIKGRTIELIFEDGKCNGKDAASAMQKLVEVDKVQVVIGGFCSSESLAAVPIAQQNKVMLLSPGSSSPDLTGISPYFARTYPSDASQGAVLAKVAWEKKNWKKVAILQEQQDYPLGITNAFTEAFRPLGGEVMKEEFAKEATDFRTQLAKLKAENADALFVNTQTPAATDRVMRQVQEMNWEPRLLVNDVTAGDTEVLGKYTSLFEGTISALFSVDPSNSTFQYLTSAYKAKYNTDVPYQSYAQTVYDAVSVVKDAIEAVGYNGEALSQWIGSLSNWKGASGTLEIKNGDRVGGHTPQVIENGQSKPLI